MKNMKLKLFLLLTVSACGLLLFAVPSTALGANKEPKSMQMDKQRKGKEFFEGMLNKIEKFDPEKAKELRELREESPEDFHTELKAYVDENRDRLGLKQPSNKMEGPMQGPSMGENRDRKPRIRNEDGQHAPREFQERRQEEFMNWLGENYPDVAESLNALQDNPEEFEEKAIQIRKDYFPVFMAEKFNPELGGLMKKDLELKFERDRLLKKIKSTEDTSKLKKIKASLEQVLSERFDLLVQKKELKYKDLLEKLKDLEAEIAKQKSSLANLKEEKDSIIEKRMKELIENENSGFSWEE